MRLRSIMVALSVGAVLCLLAPWMRSGSVDRSSIEVLSSASALQVLGGTREWLVLAAWVALPIAAALVLVAAAWGSVRLSSVAALPIGPSMVVALVAVQSSPFDVLWGAWLGASLGLTATVLASLILIDGMKRREAQ